MDYGMYPSTPTEEAAWSVLLDWLMERDPEHSVYSRAPDPRNICIPAVRGWAQTHADSLTATLLDVAERSCVPGRTLT